MQFLTMHVLTSHTHIFVSLQLNQERREEMRYYRDLAVAWENRLKIKRGSTDSGVMINSTDGSCIKKIETPGEPSTPNDYTNGINIEDCASSPSTSNTVGNNHGIRMNVEECISNSNMSDIENVFTEDFIDSKPPNNHIRRGSYTLDNPSPVLMEYLQSSENLDKKRALFISPIEKTDVINNHVTEDSADIVQNGAPVTEDSADVVQNSTELTLEDLDIPVDEADNSGPVSKELEIDNLPLRTGIFLVTRFEFWDRLSGISQKVLRN